MSHQRKLIREAMVQLLTGIEGIGDRVFESRARRLFPEELPAILVYTKSETAEIWVQGAREYKRTMKLAIEVLAKADENVDDTIDDLCQEIEQRIFRKETLDGVTSDVKYSDTDIDFEPDAETPICAARLTFDCEYYTEAPEEQFGLDDFETAHVETKPAGSTDDTEPAKDDLEMEQ